MNSTTALTCDPARIAAAYDYAAYNQLIQDLLAEGKTTGTNHSEAYLHYTRLNVQRARRWDEKTELSDDLKRELDAVAEPWVWLVLAEWWCGDVAQNLPVVAKMADYTPHIDLRILLRDENLDLMEGHKTDGGLAIPVVICIRPSDMTEIGWWGPRPDPAQQLIRDWKATPEAEREPYEKLAERLHLWYAQDKTQTLQREFTACVARWRAAGA